MAKKNTFVKNFSYWLLLAHSEYWEIFKVTYYEEYLQTAASENLLMKLRKIKIYKEFYFTLKNQCQYSTSISETSENVCFYFMIGFP